LTTGEDAIEVEVLVLTDGTGIDRRVKS